MNILCVDCILAPAFEALGHAVRSARTAGGLADARELARGFAPDLLIQQESLGARTFLSGLEDLPCPKIFWALDSHLNIHWHKYYTRLFDAVGTPHISFYAHMPEAWKPQKLFRLPWPGHSLPFRPHAERGRDLAFVGRDDPLNRPLRSRFLAGLAPFGLAPASGLDADAMLALYADARIVPNEGIAFEVNFRLTEAASAGACVLSPDVGEDQDWLYAPDRQIMAYRNVLDLREKMAFLLRRRDLAEKLGLAARAETLARHLPIHRAAAVLDAAADLVPRPADPLFLAMTLAQRGRALGETVPAALLEALNRPDRPEALALRLRCLAEAAVRQGDAAAVDVGRELRAGLALQPSPAGREEIGGVVAGCALLLGDMPLFALAWTFLHDHLPQRPPIPASPYQACLAAAEFWRAQGRLFQPGLPFRPGALCPESAFEALEAAAAHARGDAAWARAMSRLTARGKTLTLARQRALAVVADNSGAWRDRLEYGLVCLEAYDAGQGLAAIRGALRAAETAGKAPLAASILRQNGVALPPS